MTLSVIRGGLPRISHGCRRVTVNDSRGHAVCREAPDVRVRQGAAIAAELSNDPIARRRELLVVLELCAARERGARVRLEGSVTHGLDEG